MSERSGGFTNLVLRESSGSYIPEGSSASSRGSSDSEHPRIASGRISHPGRDASGPRFDPCRDRVTFPSRSGGGRCARPPATGRDPLRDQKKFLPWRPRSLFPALNPSCGAWGGISRSRTPSRRMRVGFMWRETWASAGAFPSTRTSGSVVVKTLPLPFSLLTVMSPP